MPGVTPHLSGIQVHQYYCCTYVSYGTRYTYVVITISFCVFLFFSCVASSPFVRNTARNRLGFSYRHIAMLIRSLLRYAATFGRLCPRVCSVLPCSVSWVHFFQSWNHTPRISLWERFAHIFNDISMCGVRGRTARRRNCSRAVFNLSAKDARPGGHSYG